MLKLNSKIDLPFESLNLLTTMAAQHNFKQKLLFLSIGSVLSILTLTTVILYNIVSIKTTVENNAKVERVHQQLAENKALVRSFLLNAWMDTVFVQSGTNEDYQQFQASILDIEQQLTELKVSYKDSVSAYQLNQTAEEVGLLKKNFTEVAVLISERGFKNLGLEGKLRQAVHHLEKSPFIRDKAQILTLRKNEKDFFLRKDKAYISKFQTEINSLYTHLKTSVGESERAALTSSAQQYERSFMRVAAIEEQIGLTKNSGLRSSINQNIANASTNLMALSLTLNEQYRQKITSVIVIISISLMTILVLILWVIRKFIKPVFEPMEEIQARVSKISQGNLSVSFEDLSNNGVLKTLIESFENVILKFKKTMAQVEGINNRSINKIDVHSEEDEVGKALINILQQTREVDIAEERRNWHNEGITEINQIIRLGETHGKNLLNVLCGNLTKYIRGHQGMLFTINDNEEQVFLELSGSYAKSNSGIPPKIFKGETTVGICWSEKETILLNELPSDYLEISSGLGKATPSSVVLFPLIHNNVVQGVLEISTFKKLEAYKITFLENAAAIIASEINSMQILEKNRQMVEHSQLLSAELQEQQEELRQSMEELQATQDSRNEE